MYSKRPNADRIENNPVEDKELVSVLMSVYKTKVSYLDRSVKSILDQSYRNLEFIIINDGCDSEALEYLESIRDSRVTVLYNDHNMGLAASLNKGIKAAKGKYIARMDADDYSLPERICEQVRYMEEHQDIDVLACISYDIRDGKTTGDVGGAYYKFDNTDMQIELSLAPKVFPHPTVMFRKNFLDKTGILYDEKFMRSQDYDMWARCVMKGKLDSLQKPLLLYDVSDKASVGLSEGQVHYSNMTKLKCLDRLLPDATDKEKDLYVHMREMKLTGSVDDNIELVNKLVERNRIQKIYDTRRYSLIIYFWWGRKMLYSENRQFLTDFLKRPAFMLHVIRAYFVKLPGHLMQKSYDKKMTKKALSCGITI